MLMAKQTTLGGRGWAATQTTREQDVPLLFAEYSNRFISSSFELLLLAMAEPQALQGQILLPWLPFLDLSSSSTAARV
jgi:hypothetical protein